MTKVGCSNTIQRLKDKVRSDSLQYHLDQRKLGWANFVSKYPSSCSSTRKEWSIDDSYHLGSRRIHMFTWSTQQLDENDKRADRWKDHWQTEIASSWILDHENARIQTALVCEWISNRRTKLGVYRIRRSDKRTEKSD